MDQIERNALMDRYRAGAGAVDDALAGITDDGAGSAPAEADGWTARQIVHHLADSEAMAYTRLRRLVADEEPTIQGYDEPVWARRLHYDRPIEPSIAVMRRRSGVEPPAPGVAHRGGLVTNGDAQRVGRVQRRGMGPDLRLAPARSRRPDPAGARELRRSKGSGLRGPIREEGHRPDRAESRTLQHRARHRRGLGHERRMAAADRLVPASPHERPVGAAATRLGPRRAA